MASQQSTADFLVEQMARAGGVVARKMFGEYGVFCDGKMTAVICDDQLFVKPTLAGRAIVSEMAEVVEAAPFKGAKPYFLIAGELWDEAEWLSRLIRVSTDELPAPKSKKPRKSGK